MKGTLIGLEIKVRFDDSYFQEPISCHEFLFALKTTVPFPDDAEFEGMTIMTDLYSDQSLIIKEIEWSYQYNQRIMLLSL